MQVEARQVQADAGRLQAECRQNAGRMQVQSRQVETVQEQARQAKAVQARQAKVDVRANLHL